MQSQAPASDTEIVEFTFMAIGELKSNSTASMDFVTWTPNGRPLSRIDLAAGLNLSWLTSRLPEKHLTDNSCPLRRIVPYALAVTQGA